MTLNSITIQLFTYDFAKISISPEYSGCVNAFKSNVCGEVIISVSRIDEGLQNILDCMSGKVLDDISPLPCIQPIGLLTMCHDPGEVPISCERM